MAEHGDWYWHELTTPDPERAKAFYKSVLGWDATPMPGNPDYSLWIKGDDRRGGVMKMDGPQWAGIPPHWMLYMAIDDAAASQAAVEKGGGKVVHGPFTVPQVGIILVCEDPAGAVFSLIQPALDTA